MISLSLKLTHFYYYPPVTARSTMASSSLFSLNFTLMSPSTHIGKHPFSSQCCFPSISLQNSNKQREFSLPSVASIPYQPVNVDYLEQEFSGHGVTFEDIDDSYIAKMKLQNGSTATLMLPSGLISSYKARMWHGGTDELLQTSVSEGKDGSPVIQGGASLAFNFGSDGELSWSPSSWALRAIRGNPEESIEVELICTDAEDKVEVKHILSLTEDTLSSQLVASNAKSSSIRLMGSILSHLTVSTPEATYAVGLEGSDFFSRPAFLSNFSLVPPDLGQENRHGSGKLRDHLGQHSFLPGSDKEMEGEEDENYKQLTEKMSRIYTSAPAGFTLIDRGRRNSVVVGREGFDELYLFSPGSTYESYGLYSYICVGQSALLKPVILRPGDVWTGWQHLHNPNL